MTTLSRPMTRRIALLTTVLVLAVAAPAAAQGGAFGPLPPAAPTPTATPQVVTGEEDKTARNVLFAIGGALILGFCVMGWFILRDARSVAPEPQFAAGGPRLREEGPHKHKKRAKAMARKKTRAQKQARKAHRRR
jgi:hypothetical protein